MPIRTRRAFYLVLLAGALTADASHAITFNAAVEQVLLGQRSGPVVSLNASSKRELIACVISALANMPEGRKRYVTQAADYAQMEDRFGEVVMENRAAWKQKIAKRCAGIATRRDRSDQ